MCGKDLSSSVRSIGIGIHNTCRHLNELSYISHKKEVLNSRITCRIYRSSREIEAVYGCLEGYMYSLLYLTCAVIAGSDKNTTYSHIGLRKDLILYRSGYISLMYTV